MIALGKRRASVRLNCSRVLMNSSRVNAITVAPKQS